MEERKGWFADQCEEEDPWQPFVQVAGGCFPLPVWFETEEACEAFIRNELAGLGELED